MSKDALKTLTQAIDEYTTHLGEDEKAYAILYTPLNCHLLLVDKNGKFYNEAGNFTPQNVFEARIFNGNAELRWLSESNGKGKTTIITDDSFPDAIATIAQTYLFWGKSTGQTQGDWTQFATARVGAFYVPLPNVPHQNYAGFTAVEYLKTYEDGNVAVVDERLIGIEPYQGGANND